MHEDADRHPGRDAAFDAQWWEEHYRQGVGGHGGPSPHLMAEVAGLPAGNALEAGCGKGNDAVWLARQGWRVTAVDVSPTVLREAESFATRHEPRAAARIRWVLADLTEWQPERQFDLVVSQYVHPAMPFADFAARLAGAVAPGGTLLVVGHDHADEHSAAHAPAQAWISLDTVTGALTGAGWQVEVAETRSRNVGHRQSPTAAHDLVVKARRATTST